MAGTRFGYDEDARYSAWRDDLVLDFERCRSGRALDGVWFFMADTNPLERVNGEVEWRTNVVGIFPHDASIARLVSAVVSCSELQ